MYDFYTEQMAECDREIERQFSNLKPTVPPEDLPPLSPSSKPDSHSSNGPDYDAREPAVPADWRGPGAIDGLNESTVQTISREVGTDMSRFPSEKHFCSWLGLAPHNDISGGKMLRSQTLKTANRAGQAFRMAAQWRSRNPDTAFGAFYRRMRSRSGPSRPSWPRPTKSPEPFTICSSIAYPITISVAKNTSAGLANANCTTWKNDAAKLGMTLMPSSAAAN